MGFVKTGRGKIKQVFRFIKKVGSDDFELKKTYDDENKEEHKSNGRSKKSSA